MFMMRASKKLAENQLTRMRIEWKLQHLNKLQQMQSGKKTSLLQMTNEKVEEQLKVKEDQLKKKEMLAGF